MPSERYFGKAAGPATRVRIEASKHVEWTVQRVKWIAENGDSSHATQLAACRELLDRAAGRPTTPVEVTHQDTPEELDARIAAALGEALDGPQTAEEVKQHIERD